jgi:hypothetical protein
MVSTRPHHRAAAAVLSIAALLGSPVRSGGQDLPSEPITTAGGRLVVSGEFTASGAAEDAGFLNYGDYEQNVLRRLAIGTTTALSLGDRVSLLSEVRVENGRLFDVTAAFIRLRPWKTRPVDLQVGRIPPTFGAFTRRGYGLGNPLIGLPLPYQYLTSLRADALPASADDILRMRGKGWHPVYPLGAQTDDPGLPLASSLRWDTGLQVRVGDRKVAIVGAITNGTLSKPLVRDDNTDKQLAVRATWQPSEGLAIGLSGARGGFVSRVALDALPRDVARHTTQSAVGADVEYSRDHWIVRVEGLLSSWQVPAVDAPLLDAPLRAVGITAEGQYKLRPGFYLAGRADHVGFSSIRGTLFDGRPTPWDVPVTRLEVGGGYYVRRNVIAKATYQHNWRDGEHDALYDMRTRFLAAQVMYWF